MNIRYYIDPETELPHIYRHAVKEKEVEDVLLSPGEDRPGREGSRAAIGRTSGGRYLTGQAVNRLSSAQGEKEKMKQSEFPLGWDSERVQRVLAHYESQSEEEAVAGDEVAFEALDQTIMEVPTELVPTMRELIAKHKAA